MAKQTILVNLRRPPVVSIMRCAKGRSWSAAAARKTRRPHLHNTVVTTSHLLWCFWRIWLSSSAVYRIINLTTGNSSGDILKSKFKIAAALQLDAWMVISSHASDKICFSIAAFQASTFYCYAIHSYVLWIKTKNEHQLKADSWAEMRIQYS